MNRKFLVLLVFTAVLAGTVGLVFSIPVVRAGLLPDWLSKYLPGWSGIGAVGKTESVTPAVVIPYEFQNAHEEAVIRSVEIAAPSVVSIVVTKDLPIIEQCPYDPFGDLPPELREFFGDDFGFSHPCQKGTRRQEVGGGSGFVISEDGLILTNKHVISDEEADYTILTNDGKKYSAKVLARDPVQDLAVVKAEGLAGVSALKLGDSDAIRLGQTAISIGNALGEFRNTVSVGVISGLARKITASDRRGSSETLEGLIQTDAAINPGNSGGPLLNLRGEVIGINTAVASGAQNIGFAIPINKAKRDIQSIRKSGQIEIPYLGVRYIGLNSEIAKRENLIVEQGALVRGGEDGPGVIKDSPAFKAGVLAEDIIVSINEQRIDEDHSLAELIQQYQVGDRVRLKILRNNQEINLEATLEERQF